MANFVLDAAPHRTGYSDYDPQYGPVYVIEVAENDGEWIRSTHSVDVEP